VGKSVRRRRRRRRRRWKQQQQQWQQQQQQQQCQAAACSTVGRRRVSRFCPAGRIVYIYARPYPNEPCAPQVKAKVIRKYVDKMITLAKDGSLHARRQALAFIYDKDLVSSLFDGAAERYADRAGGYTRIKPDPKVGPTGWPWSVQGPRSAGPGLGRTARVAAAGAIRARSTLPIACARMQSPPPATPLGSQRARPPLPPTLQRSAAATPPRWPTSSWCKPPSQGPRRPAAAAFGSGFWGPGSGSGPSRSRGWGLSAWRVKGLGPLCPRPGWHAAAACARLRRVVGGRWPEDGAPLRVLCTMLLFSPSSSCSSPNVPTLPAPPLRVEAYAAWHAHVSNRHACVVKSVGWGVGARGPRARAGRNPARCTPVRSRAAADAGFM
jgi:hypothetical protein